MNKAIFLDRDGTLNVDEKGYTHKVEDFELHEGVIEGLKQFKGYKLIIITNQSGIGRGIYTEEDMHKYNDHMLAEFNKHGIRIEKIYFCPHSPDDDCDCRKPKTKFIKQAEKEFDIDLKNSWVIGDHDLDAFLASNVGAKSVYLLTGHGVKHLDSARSASPDYIAANFSQASDFIIKDNEKKIIPKEKLKDLVEKLKDKKTVTINGTFDILHLGHEEILKEAKEQGDVLIVGLNSDSSVKQNKGPNRPLNNEQARAKMLANFKFVDYITIFGEETPLELLEIIKPAVHVNGSDYGESCIEAETVKKHGGKIYIVNLIQGYSTTRLIMGQMKSE
jgi:D-glycero-D-manno-heptose 1,7-bisphosphate phosphatase